MFRFVVRRRMWIYDGHIIINDHHVGINVPFDNTMYFMMDIGEVDPIYRMYLLGYAMCDDGKIRKKYKRLDGFTATLRILLGGKCCCCMKDSAEELCCICQQEFGRCKVVTT